MICPSCGRGQQKRRSGMCGECEDARAAEREWRLRQEQDGNKVTTR